MSTMTFSNSSNRSTIGNCRNTTTSQWRHLAQQHTTTTSTPLMSTACKSYALRTGISNLETWTLRICMYLDFFSKLERCARLRMYMVRLPVAIWIRIMQILHAFSRLITSFKAHKRKIGRNRTIRPMYGGDIGENNWQWAWVRWDTQETWKYAFSYSMCVFPAWTSFYNLSESIKYINRSWANDSI